MLGGKVGFSSVKSSCAVLLTSEILVSRSLTRDWRERVERRWGEREGRRLQRVRGRVGEENKLIYRVPHPLPPPFPAHLTLILVRRFQIIQLHLQRIKLISESLH